MGPTPIAIILAFMLLISFIFFSLEDRSYDTKNVMPTKTKMEGSPMKNKLRKIVKNAVKSVLSNLSNIGAGIVVTLLSAVSPLHYR